MNNAADKVQIGRSGGLDRRAQGSLFFFHLGARPKCKTGHCRFMRVCERWGCSYFSKESAVKNNVPTIEDATPHKR
jgi:hypothetical protein